MAQEQAGPAVEIAEAGLGVPNGALADALVSLDSALRVRSASSHAATLLGCAGQELRGRLAASCPLLAGAPVLAALRATAEGGRRTALEAVLPGSASWIELRAYPASDGLTLLLHDVTVRRDQAARGRLLETCLDHINDAVLVTEVEPAEEPGPRIVFANAAFTRMTGYAAEEVLGRSPRLLQGPLTQRAELDRMGAALRDRRPVRAELINYRKSGEPFWVEMDIAPVSNGDGPATHMVAVGRDVTERRRLQAELRQQAALLDQVQEAIVLLAEDGSILTWNRAAELIYGWSAEEAVGRDARGLLREDPALAPALDRELAETGRWSRRLVHRRRDGAAIQVDANATLLRHADGSGRGTLVVLADVTQRLQMEERLRRAQRLEAIGQLTSGIAHDFNNLLTVVLGNAELLTDLLEGQGEPHHMAALILGAAERGAELTGRLLAFSRQQALAPEAVDLAPLLEGLAGTLRRSLGEGVELRLEAAPELPPALVDRLHLEAALLNLCLNAREAMPDGGRVTITAGLARLGPEDAGGEAEAVPGDYLMLAVADTGHGMTPEVAARAVEPFFTTREPGQGSGLGLSMVYGFLQQSGGQVRIATGPGLGCTVRLYLPPARPGAA